MKDRVLKIRKDKKLSQEKFGEKLGITGAAVSRLESGDRGLTEQMIRAICREFQISEEWLRTGKGNMDIYKTPNVKISSFIANIVTQDKETFKSRVVEMLAELTDEEWECIEKKVDKFLNK